jgi:hypothetical protein
VAVIVDRARPAEVSAMLVDAYGLTRRQRDVLERILLGRSMTQLAHGLGISEHHRPRPPHGDLPADGCLKRVRAGGPLQFEQYDPRVWSDVPPSPYGGFLDAPD